MGLAFQIRDDILDAESINYKNDKNKNSDDEYFKTILSAYQTIRESVKGK